MAMQQCVICYEELTDSLSAAPCGHVFHSVCIEKWQQSGSFCPVCHADLPAKLLKLYFETQQASSEAIGGSTASSTEGEAANNQSAEVTTLRRELACSNRFIEVSKAACAEHIDKLKELQDNILEFRMAAMVSRNELEGALKETQAKLQTTQLDACKQHKEANKLRREMVGINERLHKFQGEKVAHSYLSQFTPQAKGSRPLNGLGQVDVEVVLRQVARGGTQADTIIRGQHEQLSGAMEREQKTKRDLRKAKEENETAASEVQNVRVKLFKSKKDVYRLEKELNKARIEAQDAAAARSPSVGSFVDAAQKQLCKQGGKSSWVLARKPDSGLLRAGNERGTKRSAPTGGGAGRIAPLDPNERIFSAKRRAVTLEKEEDMVSLGSDDDESSSDAVDEEQNVSPGQRRTHPALARGRLGMETVLLPALSSHSFLTTAARGGGPRSQPGKFIRSGFNAMGGRHNVCNSSTKRVCLRDEKTQAGARS